MATAKRLEYIQSLANSKEQIEKYQGLIDELIGRTAQDGNIDDFDLVLRQRKMMAPFNPLHYGSINCLCTVLSAGVTHAVCRPVS